MDDMETIKVKITEDGVFDEKTERIPKGTVLELETPGGEIPTYLVGKCRDLGEDAAPVKTDVPVLNPKKQKEFDDADLAQIKGVGASTAVTLQEAGISTVTELSEAEDTALSKLPSAMMAKAVDWREQAKALVAQAATAAED